MRDKRYMEKGNKAYFIYFVGMTIDAIEETNFRPYVILPNGVTRYDLRSLDDCEEWTDELRNKAKRAFDVLGI